MTLMPIAQVVLRKQFSQLYAWGRPCETKADDCTPPAA
jgi:hypothetical protein